MKIGSRVRICDGSYMLTQLPDGRLSHSSKAIPTIGHNEDVWEVVLINIALPTQDFSEHQLGRFTNNCLIKNTVNGELWFCSYINIRTI